MNVCYFYNYTFGGSHSESGPSVVNDPNAVTSLSLDRASPPCSFFLLASQSHPSQPSEARKRGPMELTLTVSDRYQGEPLPAKDATWHQRGPDPPVGRDGLILPAAADLRAPSGGHHEWHSASLLRCRVAAGGAYPGRFLQVWASTRGCAALGGRAGCLPLLFLVECSF